MSARNGGPTVPRLAIWHSPSVVTHFGPEEIDEMVTHLARIATTRRFDCTDRIFAIDALERLGMPSLLALTRIADDRILWSSVRLAALGAIERIQFGDEAPRWRQQEAAVA